METHNTGITVNLVNDAEFRKLFDDFYIPLCVFTHKYVENEAIAADIAQDCFVKLWQIREDFFYLHQVKSFLYTTARNKALNEIEHSKVMDEYAERVIKKSKDSFFHDHVIEEETYRILTGAIEKLPKQMKAIMQLALEGKPNAEIAESLDVSVETVRSLKKIAYRKLRDILRKHYYLLFLFV